MNIKTITYKLLAVIAFLTFVACQDDVQITTGTSDGTEMTGIAAHMTRAGQVAELKDYVGKSEFENEDRIVFTTIKRTSNPISQFTYSNLEFECAASTSAEGVTSIGWSRDKTKGSTASTDAHPDRIYWSDATNPHTFIGYCTPQQGGGEAFDWTQKTANGIDAYYGSIGNPTIHESTDIIDYRSTFDVAGNETLSGNVELCKNDILLTHSTEVKAEDAIAKLYFYHGLAQVRVIVNISDFAAGGGADTLSRVSNMVLKDMLTMYKWSKNGVATEKLSNGDQTILNELYPSAAVTYDQKKDFNLWIPQPKGVGWKSSRTFTFYGMVVPTEIPAIDPEHPETALSFSFNVKYPNPMKPTEMVTHTYNASIGGIRFDAGKCTTISISLNHKNEKMTIGAEYDDWDFVDTPDQGSLIKNHTMLTSAERSAVTIIGDEKATIDDATWLYVDPSTHRILDVYGNDGSDKHPFQISTADQFLSFAYEVKGTGRISTTYVDSLGVNKTLDGAFDFTDCYVKLDADITLQPNANVMHDAEGFYALDSNGNRTASTGIVWPGIGDTDKPFNGNFLGSSCYINKLYGKDLFTYLGPNAIVEHIFISKTLGITGKGSVAEVNEGVICGLNVEGDIKVEDTDADYCGSIVGLNTGVLLACSHIGDTEGYGIVGALVGKNDGVLAVCYCVGDAKTLSTGGHAYAGVGDFTPRSIAYCCYFNKDKFTGQDYSDLTAYGTIGHVAFPLSTVQMQSNRFVNLPYVIDPNTNMPTEGNIIDDGTKHTDIFYSHFSLNGGLRRFVEYFFAVYAQTPDNQDIIYLHAPGATEDHVENQVPLAKTIARWLWEHFDYTRDGALRYEFKFVPAAYPKLSASRCLRSCSFCLRAARRSASPSASLPTPSVGMTKCEGGNLNQQGALQNGKGVG